MAERKRGRPSTYDPQLAKQILDRLENGESLNKICIALDISPNTVKHWSRNEKLGSFSVDYARAREDGIYALVDKGRDEVDDVELDKLAIDKVRLKIDLYKFLIAHFLKSKNTGDPQPKEIEPLQLVVKAKLAKP